MLHPAFQLRVASPCTASWEGMEERSGGRHCPSCSKLVHDFTRMTETRARASAWLFGSSWEKEGLCGRVRTRPEGGNQFAPEPEPKSAFASAPAVLAAAIGLSALEGCSGVLPEEAKTPMIDVSPAHPGSTRHECSEKAEEPLTDGVQEPVRITESAPRPAIAGHVNVSGTINPDDGPPRAVPAGPAMAFPEQTLVNGGDTLVLKRPTFLHGSAMLSLVDQARLAEVVKTMKAHTGFNLLVLGNADSSEGTPDELSARRAQAVVGYLQTAGIPAHRLRAMGAGARTPFAPSDTAENKEKNRRVDFQIDEIMITGGAMGRLDTPSFQPSAVALQSADRKLVEEVSKLIRTRRELGVIRVVGNASADEVGEDEGEAVALSEKRARGVVSLLIDAGVPAERLVAVGVGSSRPAQSASGEHLRRVDFELSRTST